MNASTASSSSFFGRSCGGHQACHCTLAAGLAFGFAILSPTVITETAWAQASAGGRTLEEITVTARRREESLQDIPVTVNVFTADDLDARNILTLPEVARYAPNVVIDAAINSAGPSNNIAVFIRGIGATDYTLTTDPGVATYVDGVYMSRSIGGVLDLLTVESIEILKGPQGTLFGRNTVGGAVNITSQKPHDEFEARVRATAGEDGRLEGTLALNIPLGEAVFSSVSLQYREIDGWVTNLDVGADGLPNTPDDTIGGPDWGARERISVRAALRWEAGDSVTVDLAADYMDEDADPAPFVLVDVVSGFAEAPLPANWNVLTTPLPPPRRRLPRLSPFYLTVSL